YDADGRRTKKIGEEGIRQYVYDDTSLLAEYDTNGNEVAKYDYGADRLIRLTRTDEGTRYMTFDGLGSVTGLTNLSGEVTAAYHLDAWGQFRFTTELAPSKNRFGFTGHYWDNEAGLYYAKARYYDPFTARFTQSDSFLGNIDNPPSLHRYFYAADNPTRYTDPDGHAFGEGTAVGFGLGALWGVGQAINTYWHDTLKGDYRRGWTDHVGLIGQNAIGGAELGLAYDAAPYLAPVAALGTPGRAVAGGVLGGLAGAGLDALTATGEAATSDEFIAGQRRGAATGALIGGLIGAAPEIAAGFATYGAYQGAQTIKEGNFASTIVGAGEIGLSVAPFGFKGVRQATFGRIQSAIDKQLGLGFLDDLEFGVPGMERLGAYGGEPLLPLVPAARKGPHRATLTVSDTEGTTIHTEKLISGGSGKANPTWPEQGAVHTEGKGSALVREMLERGFDVGFAQYQGELRPCPMCKGTMNRLHREAGVPSAYEYPGGVPWRSTNKPLRPRRPKVDE
ncbi:MAG: RHS repeat-associated core domain-containing protein, partial [Vicinamibacteria bacterium]